MERLLRLTRPDRPAGVGTLADRLTDLRDATALTSDRARATYARSRCLGDNSARPYFVDDAEAAGLRFVFDNGRTAAGICPRRISGGVGLIDFDGDGWLDVIASKAGRSSAAGDPECPPRRGRPAVPEPRRRDIRGRHRRLRHRRHRRGKGYGHGRGGRRLRQRRPSRPVRHPAGGPTPSIAIGATDVRGRHRTRAGLAGDRDWPTSAAFADLDNDGDLDLYVCHYMIWDPAHPRLCHERDGRLLSTVTRAKSSRARPCLPQRRRSFRRRHRRLGLRRRRRRGLGVVAADLDDDDRIDLFVANDGTANYLFRNLGGFRFEETRARGRRGRQCRRGATRRGWGWPAATSTATAGPT